MYILGALTSVCTMAYLDRDLVVLLLEPIKESLKLTDTELGALTGLGFGLFYATLGLPIARYADRGNRVTIAAVAIALWGVTAMAYPLITAFGQLMLLRIAAAIGESGCLPPTYSLIGDYFPAPAARVRAMTIFWLAGPIAALVSFIAGGWINGIYGWRLTFFIAGTPALLLAMLLNGTLKEPRLEKSSSPRGTPPSSSMAQTVGTLWRRRSSRHLSAAIILLFAMGLGLSPWYAAFMMRNHDMKTPELGVWFGMIFGVSGILGASMGGYVCTRWLIRSERAQMRISAAIVAALFPCYILFLLAPGKYLAMSALIPLALASNFFLGPTFALLQRLVPEDMRATSLALIMLVANLLGMGFGPQVVGLLSDALQVVFRHDSLRYAMLSFSFLSLWAAYHQWQVARTITADLSTISASDEPIPVSF